MKNTIKTDILPADYIKKNLHLNEQNSSYKKEFIVSNLNEITIKIISTSTRVTSPVSQIR